MLAGHGADWSPVDMTDDEQADFIASLSPAELIEFGFAAKPSPYRHQCRDLYHAGRHDHATEFHGVRTIAIRSLRAARALAVAAGDMMEVSSIERDMAAYRMMAEADLLIDALQNL
ncbi:hypothetical protein ASE85_03210 [Sphingobium sp. Leaf26]|nr:hypothetical protein ASE85_03210 [Sphingobium sp. Leaf26]